MKLLMLFYFVLYLNSVESLKILVCFPLPVKSISILGQNAVKHLLDAGHEVTYITVYPLKNPPSKNFRQIDISSNDMSDVVKTEKLTLKYVLENNIGADKGKDIQEFCTENARLTFQNENLINFLQNPNERFDAVIVDFLETEVFAGLAVLYDCPMIWLYSMGADWQVLSLIDEGINPAYNPNYLSTSTNPLSFFERIESLWARIEWQFVKSFTMLPKERDIYKQTFGPLLTKRGRTLPAYEDVMYNASLIFGNEHNAIKHRPKTPQNFKYIGGFHVEDPVKPLPKDLQDLMDKAKHGVIYFSMGTFWKSKDIPKKLVTGLLKTFGELKQTVIWKFEEDLPDLPKNVHIVHWAPQPSILAHPNLKIFITHGGLLSSIEAIHFGVPIIGLPIAFDQFRNIKKAVENGFGLHVPLNHDMPKNLKPAIDVMLNDERYREKVKELSFIYHDRQTKPGAELVHWVQHVVRTRGAPLLRSPALRVPLYQRLYLDLLVFILIIVSIFCYFIRSMFKKFIVSDQKKNN